MDPVKPLLIDRLIKRGADPSSVDAILRSLSKVLFADPNIDPAAANEKLHYLGWQEIEVDYQLLQLALAHFESGFGNDAMAFGQDDRRRQAIRLREAEISPIGLNEI